MCYFVECWQIPCTWDIILPILQIGKLMFNEIKKLAQSLLSVAESKEKSLDMTTQPYQCIILNVRA